MENFTKEFYLENRKKTNFQKQILFLEAIQNTNLMI